MYTLIIIFYVALGAMIAMIAMKRHEIMSSRPTLFSRLGKGSDHLFHAVYESILTSVRYVNKHTLIAVTQWIAYHILLRARKVYVDVKQAALDNPHAKKVIDAVRGRGEVTSQGVSFYLRRISEKKA